MEDVKQEKEVIKEIVKEVDNTQLEELKQQLEKIKEENKILNQEFSKLKEESNKVDVIEEKPREKNINLWKEVF